MFFAIRKALSRLLFPLPVTVLTLLLGLILVWIERRAKLGRALLAVGLVMLVVFASAPTSNAILRPLERQYAPLGPEEVAAIDWDQVSTIVAFSGCRVADDRRPITSQITRATVFRLIEGIRLYQACPECTLILSGGGSGCDLDAPVETLTNYRFAVSFGVAPEDIIIERESWDTADQARILAEMLGEEPFIVVTAASHMPRTMMLLEAQGLAAIPAPTDFAAGSLGIDEWETFRLDAFYPHAEALWRSERAIYEYLGLLWLRLGAPF